MSARTVLSRLRSEESGLGMIELLVSMLLGGLLLAMVGAMFVGIAATTTDANETRQSAASGGTIASGVSAAVHGAVQNAVSGQLTPDPAVIEATADTLTLTSLADTDAAHPAPLRIRFLVLDGRLVEQRWTASASGAYWTFPTGAPTSSRILGGIVLTDGTAPLFAYLDVNGDELVPGSGGLTPDQRADVAAVRLTLRVRPESSPDGRIVELRNTIGMPNLGYSGGAA